MNEKHYTVYCHINKINGKLYIGQTGCVPYTRRWQGHAVSGSPYRGCARFQNAINKYGWNNFEHMAIIENLSLEEANIIEEFLINKYHTANKLYGYNIALGGNNRTCSEETRQKIKEHHADFSGKNHPMYGKHHSEATKQLIREKALGRKLTEEARKKISERTKGANNPRAKTVLCIETGQIFNTAKEAALWAKVDNSTICKCCNGRIKTCGIHPITKERLHWKYINKENDAE